MGPIIGDVPVCGDRVLRGAIRTQVATKAEWKACDETTEARVTKFEALFTAKEAHMQEEIAQALAKEKEV